MCCTGPDSFYATDPQPSYQFGVHRSNLEYPKGFLNQVHIRGTERVWIVYNDAIDFTKTTAGSAEEFAIKVCQLWPSTPPQADPPIQPSTRRGFPPQKLNKYVHPGVPSGVLTHPLSPPPRQLATHSPAYLSPKLGLFSPEKDGAVGCGLHPPAPSCTPLLHTWLPPSLMPRRRPSWPTGGTGVAALHLSLF